MRIERQGAFEGLARAKELGVPVLRRFGTRLLVLPRLGVVQRRGGAQRVDVLAVVLAERDHGEVPGELDLARLDEEVGVEGAEVDAVGTRLEGLFEQGVGAGKVAGLQRHQSEPGFRCGRDYVSDRAGQEEERRAPSTYSGCWLNNRS